MAVLLLAACSDDPTTPLPPLALTALAVESANGEMYPDFARQTRHYAVRCEPSTELTLTATPSAPSDRVAIDGQQPVRGERTVQLIDLLPDQDISVEVSRASAATERYTVHCLAEDFPEIEVVRADPEASTDLILVSPKFRENGERKSYLAILDNNGVPRFRRKIDATVNDFKRHANGVYSYALSTGQNAFGIRDWVIVLLDENFNEIERVTTVGLTQTDTHDFLFTEEGNRILLSYHSNPRDMTAFGLAADEIVGDSVIQEVTPQGQVVFEWNSWDHIDLNDCRQSGYPRFPSDYAHVNSVDLTADGDLFASFRGCSQILKIDRPTGEVVWQLGGSSGDFLITGDAFGEFCGQHSAIERPDNGVVLFDNGLYCLGAREPTFGQFSRVVEYELDMAAGQAQWVRDFSLGGTYQSLSTSQGSVQPLENGNWFISWGNGPDIDTSVSEVNPEGEEVFTMNVRVGGAIATSYRAFRESSLPAD